MKFRVKDMDIASGGILIAVIRIATQYNTFKNVIVSGGDYLINSKKVKQMEKEELKKKK